MVRDTAEARRSLGRWHVYCWCGAEVRPEAATDESGQAVTKGDQKMEITVKINKQDIIDWFGDYKDRAREIHEEIAGNGTSSRYMGHGLDPETGEYDVDECIEHDNADLTARYAQALADGMVKANPGATVEVEMGDVHDHKIDVDGVNGEEYERLLSSLEDDYQAVCAELADWDWLPA